MEYIFILLGLLLIWGSACLFAPEKGKKWVFWGGFACMVTVVLLHLVFYPYRVERILADLSKLI